MPASTGTSARASSGWPECRHEGSHLIRRLVYVAFFVEVGLLLIVLPWSAFWDQNYFAGLFPWLKDVLTNNYIRGAVSGLGFVNLVAGFAELTLVFVARDRLRQGYGESADASAKAERPDATFSDTTGRSR